MEIGLGETTTMEQRPAPPVIRGSGNGKPAECQNRARAKVGTGPTGHMIIYVLTDIPAGREIFNTYGEYSNDKLLQDYGFVLPHNAFNTVTLARSVVEEAAEESLGASHCRSRLAFVQRFADMLGLEQEGEEEEEAYLEEEEEEDDDEEDGDKHSDNEPGDNGGSETRGMVAFFELAADGQLAPGLLALLGVLHASAAEFEAWKLLPRASQRSLLAEHMQQERVLQSPTCRRTLRGGLERRLRAYAGAPTLAAEDRVRWSKEHFVNGRQRDALALRISEKSILEHYLHLCRADAQ